MAIAYKPAYNEIYLAFRGTDNWTSLSPSFNIRGMQNGYQGNFHQGYVQEVLKYPLSVFFEILINHPDLSIILTGHSLGGALATIATASLLHNGRYNHIVNRIRCIVFGAPNMCDRSCAEYFDMHFPNHFDLYINDRDIIPFVFTIISDLNIVPTFIDHTFSSFFWFINSEILAMIRLISGEIYRSINPRYQSFGNTFQINPTQSDINRVNTEDLLANINAEMTDFAHVFNRMCEDLDDHQIENYTRHIFDHTIFRHRLVAPFDGQIRTCVGGHPLLDQFTISTDRCTLF